MVTMVTPFWAKHPVLSVARALVLKAPTADATLLRLVTRTTVTDKLSATVTRATRVRLKYLCICVHVYDLLLCCSSHQYFLRYVAS